jgi:hypothetical protein
LVACFKDDLMEKLFTRNLRTVLTSPVAEFLGGVVRFRGCSFGGPEFLKRSYVVKTTPRKTQEITRADYATQFLNVHFLNRHRAQA